MFANRFPLVAYLRQSKIDGAKHSGAILKVLVTFIRQHWPKVQIVFRGDSGFCRQLILNWCERHRVDYLVGIARNRRLEALVDPVWPHAEQRHQQRRQEGLPGSTRWFWRYPYRAGSWRKTRSVIARWRSQIKGVIHVLSSPPCRATTLNCTAKNTAPEATWRIGSRISS